MAVSLYKFNRADLKPPFLKLVFSKDGLAFGSKLLIFLCFCYVLKFALKLEHTEGTEGCICIYLLFLLVLAA